MDSEKGKQFWDHVGPMLAEGKAEVGTIMGGGCIRVSGQFLAMPYHKGEGLVVKLPRPRVAELIEAGRGEPFAPTGRVFREWVLVRQYDREFWNQLLEEGRQFVGKS